MSKTAAGGSKNGSSGSKLAAPAKSGAAAKPTAARPRDLRQARFAVTFSQVVAVLMRDQNFRKLRLADLEWLVLPAVMSGQFRLAQAPASLTARTPAKAGPGNAQAPAAGQANASAADAMLVPVAVALWASVSPEIDKALSENLDKQVRLHPTQWASGSNLWLMAVAGDQRALPGFLKQLREQEFKGKVVKTRVRGADGKVAIKTLGGKGA